jgi:ATP-dependent helicase/nuclease subunit A
VNAPRRIPAQVIADQRRASDPAISAWVSANAGSGKTHVLTQRVISLLLKGEDPAKILCITFTKAAAANMASRIFRDLAAWISLDDTALDREISKIAGESNAAARARARRLFALALETPGGLKVQTIHAFCTRLLHQFPFEADVAAGFSVLDEATEQQLLDRITLAVLLEGAGKRDSPLGRALEAAVAAAGDQTLQEVLREAIGARERIRHWVEISGSNEAAVAQLAQALGVGPDETVAGIEADFLAQSAISPGEWDSIAAILTQGQKSDQSQGALFAGLTALDQRQRLASYLSIFCTKEMKPRARIVTQAISDLDPFLAERLRSEQDRICALLERKNAVICLEKSRALLTLAHEILARYRAEKDRRGLLDYDDLIDRTLTLFQKASAAWVLFKLDLGINHLLIDEAQDTSPKQWEIIRTLAGEFTSGAGARTVKRTLFAVGDDKQSIFSFQGADPKIFAMMARDFEADFRNAGLAFERVPLRTSFRSGAAILGAVDTVFARPQAHAGLTGDPTATVHEYLADTAPGCVDIWPLTRADAKEKPEGWDAPFDARSETSPQIRLARRIAQNVALWRTAGTRPGDVLVLVRQRGSLFESIIRALKDARIPVAGADRLILTDHIAVMDLIALANALLLPQDDLALAAVLKSPLFGFDEDDLFRIAWDRGEKSLRMSLLGQASENERYAQAASAIARLTDDARRLSPFAFYARVLGADGGRRKFLSRLGPEANDALDEFLNLALDYESRETPSLQGFVAWLRAAQTQVKRDMEQGRDEVRVMTVHGAKGLEAPIVILADTTTRPAGYHPPRLIPVSVNGTEALVWAGARADDPAAVSYAREGILAANENEYRRLLYVAMTRAQERLVVCGVARRPTQNDDAPKPDGCWYHLIEQALVETGDAEAQSVEIDAEDGEGKIRRYLKSQLRPPRPATPEQPRPEDALPGFLTHAAAADATRVKPVSPSEAWDESGAGVPAAAGAERGRAMRRGRLVHRLMQSLPDIPAARRGEAARLYLARAGGDEFDEAAREEIAAQVQAMLDDVRFAPLFTAGSRAELPLVGHVARQGRAPLPVSGQIDRLAVTAERVLIADYKTNHAPPRTLDEALAAYPDYVLQLALYRALLGAIYPDRPVRAALVWTETPDLMEIPAHSLDAALARLTSA